MPMPRQTAMLKFSLFRSSTCTVALQKRAIHTPLNSDKPEIAPIYEKLHQGTVTHCNFISQVVDYWAKNPRKLAIRSINQDSDEREDLTYTQLAQKGSQLANFFVNKGIKKGDTVALILGQQTAWWYSLVGLMRQGIAVVPCPRLLTSSDLLYRINDLGINGIIADSLSLEKIDVIQDKTPSLKVKATPGLAKDQWLSLSDLNNYCNVISSAIHTTIEDPCIYLYTSGTTGQPKAVIHHHDYPFFHWPTGKRWLKATEEDLVYNASDTGWGFTFWITSAVWSVGAKLLITPTNKKFNPQKMLNTLQAEPITIFCAAPTVLRLLVAQKNFCDFVFPHLKRIVTVGEALDETVIKQFESRGIDVAVGFGQAETPLLVGRVDNQSHVPNTMGKSIDPYKIVVLDEQMQPMPPGSIGQIAVDLIKCTKGGVMRGYANAPEKTQKAFSPDRHYYLTGDWAEYRKDGFFVYHGRKDDLIKSRGYRIGPDEVEKAGMSHHAVAKIAVVGIPTKLNSFIVKAFVLLKPGYSSTPSLTQSIQEHIKKNTAPYKYPREVECLTLEEWGKYETISGKIRRAALREREKAKLQDDSAVDEVLSNQNISL